jgi:hypothetical protein
VVQGQWTLDNYNYNKSEGRGVAQSDEEAASDQGEAGAQHTLGFRLATGLGVAQNDEEAARWFRKAADQGDAESQFALGGHVCRGPRVGAERRGGGVVASQGR